jgi:hypothetical protein
MNWIIVSRNAILCTAGIPESNLNKDNACMDMVDYATLLLSLYRTSKCYVVRRLLAFTHLYALARLASE